MTLTFLGTGTSMGVPMIGCNCDTCTSSDPRDRRLRTSVWIRQEEFHLIIDTGIDFRQQALTYQIPSLDAVLFTHHHVDHIFGLDDIRPVNFLQNKTVSIYAGSETSRHLQRVFPYIFEENDYPSDVPRIKHHLLSNIPFEAGGLKIIPVPLLHGNLHVLGYRIGDLAYCTDVSHIPAESYALLQGLKVLILGALRNRPHPTHFTIQQAILEAEKIAAEKTYLVHMSHELKHQDMLTYLPEHIEPAFDGLMLSLNSKTDESSYEK